MREQLSRHGVEHREDRDGEGRADGHMRQRRDVPRHREGGRAAAAPARRRRGLPAAQTCCAQPMVNTGYLDEAVPVVRSFVEAFAGYDAVVTPAGRAPARRGTSTRSWRGAPVTRRCSGGRRDRAEGLRAHRVPGRRARRDGRRRLVPAQGDLPPDLPLVADARAWGTGRTRLLGRCAASSWWTAPRRGVLRLRRHVRGEERRHVGGDGLRQGAARARDRRRGAGGRRQLLPDAHRRDAVAPARRRPGHAPRRDPGRRPRSGARDDAAPSSAMPAFPTAARAGAGRHPAAAQPRPRHPHHPRQARRGRRRGRRLGGAAARRARPSRTTRCAPRQPPRDARGVADPRRRDRPLGARRRGGVRDRRRGRAGPRRGRGGQGQVDGDRRDRPQRGAGGRGHRRLGDRPGRAHRPARRRPALATSWCRRSTATGPRSARSSGAGWATSGEPAPDDLTDEPAVLAAAARAHLREKFLRAKVAVSAAPTSRSPTPARSSWSSPRATAGCA